MISGRASAEDTRAFSGRSAAAPGHFRDARGLTLSSIGLGTYLGAEDAATDRGLRGVRRRSRSRPASTSSTRRSTTAARGASGRSGGPSRAAFAAGAAPRGRGLRVDQGRVPAARRGGSPAAARVHPRDLPRAPASRPARRSSAAGTASRPGTCATRSPGAARTSASRRSTSTTSTTSRRSARPWTPATFTAAARAPRSRCWRTRPSRGRDRAVGPRDVGRPARSCRSIPSTSRWPRSLAVAARGRGRRAITSAPSSSRSTSRCPGDRLSLAGLAGGAGVRARGGPGAGARRVRLGLAPPGPARRASCPRRSRRRSPRRLSGRRAGAPVLAFGAGNDRRASSAFRPPRTLERTSPSRRSRRPIPRRSWASFPKSFGVRLYGAGLGAFGCRRAGCDSCSISTDFDRIVSSRPGPRVSAAGVGSSCPKTPGPGKRCVGIRSDGRAPRARATVRPTVSPVRTGGGGAVGARPWRRRRRRPAPASTDAPRSSTAAGPERPVEGVLYLPPKETRRGSPRLGQGQLSAVAAATRSFRASSSRAKAWRPAR